MNRAAQDRLLEIAERDGKLTAESVLVDAEDPASPLHPFIEWDDEQAAHEHRLSQCRALIRKVNVEVVRQDSPTPRRVRALVHIPSTDSYQPLRTVMDDAEMRAEHIAALKRRMSALRVEIKVYSEFDPVTHAIEQVLDEEAA